jgi:TFIIF-interacting CTD phosphatase-like protein|uniref:FCP1 homology domain-containing protein n=1 Tax=viral metagenome TaxID=1070528 RepID=A0A6C0IZE6_9ZZZZ
MKKKTNYVILDLDETLISAIEDFDTKYKTKSYNMDDYYMVYERPHLQKFLDYLFKKFNVIVWTAASKDYALFIIDKILLSKDNRKLDYIFFRYHCDISKKYQHGSKNLHLLWDDYNIHGLTPFNTIIIDDYDEVHKIQEGNCVIAEEWDVTKEDSDKDEYFLRLIPLLDKFNKSQRKNPAKKINKALKSDSSPL